MTAPPTPSLLTLDFRACFAFERVLAPKAPRGSWPRRLGVKTQCIVHRALSDRVGVVSPLLLPPLPSPFPPSTPPPPPPCAGMALAASGHYEEAEEELLTVKRESYQREPVFLLWVARCLIANGKAKAAWEIYAQQETAAEAFGLLQLIAHDSYARGAFLYAAKAFDALERIDPNPEYWEGKRGACAGVFQARYPTHSTRPTPPTQLPLSVPAVLGGASRRFAQAPRPARFTDDYLRLPPPPLPAAASRHRFSFRRVPCAASGSGQGARG